MTKCTCPNCNFIFNTTPAKKKQEVLTEIRDGKTYYGIMVNYTTGPRITWMSFKPDMKPKSSAVRARIAARKAGLIRMPAYWA